MPNDLDVETMRVANRTSPDGTGASPLGTGTDTRDASDSRLVSDERTYPGRRGDISPKGEQFILASWATMAAGLWLIISPFVLTYAGFAHRARANDLILGCLVASMGATRVFGNYRSGRLNQLISALTVLPGIWLVIAPFVLSYTDHVRPTYSSIITGIAVILFAAWSYITSRYDRDDNR